MACRSTFPTASGRRRTGGAAGEAAVALDPITKEQIAAAENVLGLSWRDKDREMMLPTLQRALAGLHRAARRSAAERRAAGVSL